MSASDFAMLVIVGLSSVAAGLVYAVLARQRPAFLAAKILSWTAAIGFGSLGVIWGSTNATYPLGWRVLAGALIAAIVAGALTWAIADINGQNKGSIDSGTGSAAVARLAELGWTVKPGENEILFEIAGSSLPPMQESSTYFSQLNRPFRLHFQSVKGLEGLHFLAGIANCDTIEINAGEFTDISELRGFSHLTKLIISQVPLNGVGVVDASPLSSLVNLQELGLGMTRVRFADPLASLKNLKTLYLGQTLISDLSPISGLPSVEKLDIRDARAADLTPLVNYQNLTDLTISGEQVPGLVNLSHLQNLKRLVLIDQRHVDLVPVGKLANLESLSVWGPPEFDLLPLQHLSKLQSLKISGLAFGRPLSAVANAQIIGDLKELKTLTVGQLQITNLNFMQNLTNLTELNLSQLPIIDIGPLHGLASLKKISFADIPVVDISPLLGLPRLSEFSILRVPARADVLKELERRGVKITAN
jgi:Leucine-rich repeat (LRR) protein